MRLKLTIRKSESIVCKNVKKKKIRRRTNIDAEWCRIIEKPQINFKFKWAKSGYQTNNWILLLKKMNMNLLYSSI